MINYYEFTKLNEDIESINFYNSISKKELTNILDTTLNNIDYYLNYYAEFLNCSFKGSDYHEHYYLMKSLSEDINNIKIILNILKNDGDSNE